MNDNLAEDMVEICMNSERSYELAMQFQEPHSTSVETYLKQWPEEHVEAQEMADRMNGVMLAAEANLRAAIYMASEALGTHPATLAAMAVTRMTLSITADFVAEGETIQ